MSENVIEQLTIEDLRECLGRANFDGISPPPTSPIDNGDPALESELEGLIPEVDEEKVKQISEELSNLLQSNVANRDGTQVPFFMAEKGEGKKKSPTFLDKLSKLLFNIGEPEKHEPIFTEDLFPLSTRKVKSSDPLLPPPDGQKVRITKSASENHFSKGIGLTSSVEELAKIELGVEETTVDREVILNFKYRECMKQAKTMVNLSYAQLKMLLDSLQLPLDVNSRAGTGELGLFLLPLNEIGKDYLLKGKRVKLSIGRNDSNIFVGKSRVVSRHQCQIFNELNKVNLKLTG